MRIAQVAPLFESVPPKAYGGIERIVHYLTEALVEAGHDVTLFASGDSETRAELIPITRSALRLSKTPADPAVWHIKELMEVVRRAADFDIVHFHTDYHHFPAWRYQETPQVTTMHNRTDSPELAVVFDEFPDMAVVSISDSQRQFIPQADWIATVYNGTPFEEYTFQDKPGDYFVFLGRFTPEKGPVEAIEIARRTGVPLKMAAKIDVSDREYFADKIEPLLEDPLIEFIGEADHAAKNELLGGARALLFPISWPEPFGLVMTEAMACGTPVIAFRNGSVDEVMRNGKTGFVVESVEQAVDAVGKIDSISRRECRQYVEERFSVAAMAEGYLGVYERLIGTPNLPIPATHRSTTPDGSVFPAR